MSFVINQNDWRLRNQIKYLKGAELVQTNYKNKYRNWDHDHCDFCWAKFSEVTDIGYCTLDGYYWICSNCFNDFKEMFKWKVINFKRS